MKDMGIVRGSEAQAVPLIIGIDTVYVHTDIKAIPNMFEGVEDNLYEYNEVQYDKDEYLQIMANQNVDLLNQITDLQLALCEVYERSL